MTIEFNSRACIDKQPFKGILITPPIDEKYWIARVPLSEDQAIVCFPKFGCIGCGFQREDEDWNTNLPISEPAESLFEHIKCNKGSASIADEDCITAIKLLQEHFNSK